MRNLIDMVSKLKQMLIKIQIKNAVEKCYGVSVKAVNTMKHGGGKRKMKYTNQGFLSKEQDCLKKQLLLCRW